MNKRAVAAGGGAGRVYLGSRMGHRAPTFQMAAECGARKDRRVMFSPMDSAAT